MSAPPAPTDRVDDDPVAAVMAMMGPDILNRMNADFEDAVILVGRVLGRRPRASAAEIVAIDRSGVDMVVTDADGAQRARVDFADEVTDAMKLTEALLGLVSRARQVSGEDGQTTAEREMAEMAKVRTFVTSVTAVADIHPHLRQITFGGGDLARFWSAGPDTFVHLLLPPPGTNTLTIDAGFTWEQHGEMPEADRPVGAYYTVRRWRPDVGELDMLFVLHDGPGPAAAWAASATPGDPLALWGPRTAFHPPAGTDRYVLVADETGLPAVAGILDFLPPTATVSVIAEVADAGERHPLRAGPNIDVTWRYRDGAPPGTTTLLVDAVRAMAWPAGTPYVWGGGESRALTDVRTHVRHERGLPRAAVSLVAYWRSTATDPG